MKNRTAFTKSLVLGSCFLVLFNPTTKADTLALSLGGVTSVDLWGAGSLSAAANPGYGSFPGSSIWPGPIQSPTGGDAYLYKIDNQGGAVPGTGWGGPYPAGAGLYYGGFGSTPNTDGGTLGVVDATPVLNLQTVTFQMQIGQAFGYDLLNNDLSLVTLKYTTENGTFTLGSNTNSLLNRFYNGAVSMPTGEGGAMQPEDIYVNLWGLQWDLSGITGITSFEIQFTGVEHASLAQLQLNQSSIAYTTSAFPQDAVWTAGGADSKWTTGGNWQGGSASAQDQNVTLTGGSAVIVDANQEVGSLTLNAANGFSINSANGAALKVTSGINGRATSLSNYTINAPLQLDEYNLIDLNEYTNLTIAGPITGVGFYKQGLGSFSTTGNNVFDSNNQTLSNNGIIIRGGTNYISGTNTLTGSNKIGFNIRQDTTVVLHGGDNRLDSKFELKLLAATSKLVLGDQTGKSDLTISGIEGALVPGSKIVGGNSSVSTLTADIAAGGSKEYYGDLGGAGANENALAFTKKGAGAQILKGTSTYSGATKINGGVLQLGSVTALSANSNLQLVGGVLGLGAANYNANLGTGAGQVQFTGDGGFSASGAERTVSLNSGAGVTWGSGSFVGNNKKLILSHSSADNVVDFTNAVDLGSQTRAIQVDNGNSVTDARLSGVLSGTGGFTKTGAGTLELAAANTFTGVTTVSEGALYLAGANGAVKGNVVVGAGATLQLNNIGTANNANRIDDTAKVTLNGSIFTFSAPATASATTYSETIGELHLNAGANVINTVRVASGDTSTLNLGSLTREGGATVNFTEALIGLDRDIVAVNGSTLGNLVGAWATVGNEFAMYGSNGITATPSSQYTQNSAESAWASTQNIKLTGGSAGRTTTLTSTRQINSLNMVGASNNTIGNVIELGVNTLQVQSGGIISSGGNSTRINRINSGTLTAGTGGDAELIVTANGILSIGSTIANNGSGKVTLVKTGTNELTTTGNNTYTGDTFVNQGLLNVNGANTGGGNLTVRRSSEMYVNGSLQVNGTLTVDGYLAGTGTITYGSGAVIKGAGVFNQTFAVGSGVGQVATLAPGNSAGTINTVSQTWTTGGTYLWEIKSASTGGVSGTHWDLSNITGNLAISATSANKFTIDIYSLLLSDNSSKGVLDGWNPLSNYSWEIARTTAGITGFDAGVFALNYGDFSTYNSLGGGAFALSQSGNSLYLNFTAVPEPGRMLLLLGALTAMMFRRRR